MSKRFLFCDHRYRLLRRAAIIAILAGIGAGCSSDYTRNNWGLYKKSIEAEQDQYSSSSPYPYIDQETTSSISHGTAAPVPIQSVDARPVLAAQPDYQPKSQSRGNSAASAARSDIARSELPPPSHSAYAVSNVDPITTSGAMRRTPAVSGEGGWTNGGGTALTLRQGETLFNLSKRYGVPVSAIMKANGIHDADEVQVGQTIVIPTYTYSRNAPVSAPDNNPGTRFARAGRGSLVEPDPGTIIPLPEWRPHRYASYDARGQETRYAAATKTGTHIVSGGDTLTGIALANNVAVSELMAANGLSDHSIHAGQRLTIPAGGGYRAHLARNEVVDRVDHALAGSRNRADADTAAAGIRDARPKPAAANVDAPAQTGIGEFRWPVRGRVISGFGEKTESGRNDGIDISVPEGTAVKATENGIVVYAGDELEGFGNLLLVRHTDGWVSAYAHNKALEVKRGDEVRRGQIIARSGRTGNAEMPKLHFELRKSSLPVDPLKHLGGA